MQSDPAWGRTRAERAFGPFKNQDIRYVSGGQFNGPKPSYGRYNVSKEASDALNRSKRNQDTR